MNTLGRKRPALKRVSVLVLALALTVYLSEFSLCENKGIHSLQLDSACIGQYEKLEISFHTDSVFKNPFDEREVSVIAYFLNPEGNTISIPGFYYQEYSWVSGEGKDKLCSEGDDLWKIRFTPAKTGRYSFTVQMKIRDKAFEKSGFFQVQKSKRKGFVRLDNNSRNGFRFDNNEQFYPIGHNLAWMDVQTALKAKNYIFEYNDLLTSMSENSGNWTRIWMSSWWLALEWDSTVWHYQGLGKYSMENAWKLDSIIEHAERKGINIQLVLNTHGQFNTGKEESEWDKNPYNKINGGFLSNPEEYFTNPEAKECFKRRLRYIIARWGYSTAIMSWELWNEVDLTAYYDYESVKQWHEEMGNYIKALDPWDHLITTTFYNWENSRDIWELPALDYIQGNIYLGSPDMNSFRKEIKCMTERMTRFQKPIMIPEYGYFDKNNPEPWEYDVLESQLHMGLWISSFSKLAGTAMFWWGNYIDEKSFYYHYKALGEYFKDNDLMGGGLKECNVKIKKAKGKFDVMGLQDNNKTFIWVYPRDIYGALKRWSSKNEGIVELDQLNPGKYRITEWDTYRGIERRRWFAELEDDKLIIKLPHSIIDIAYKIVLLEDKHEDHQAAGEYRYEIDSRCLKENQPEFN